MRESDEEAVSSRWGKEKGSSRWGTRPGKVDLTTCTGYIFVHVTHERPTQ